MLFVFESPGESTAYFISLCHQTMVQAVTGSERVWIKKVNGSGEMELSSTFQVNGQILLLP